jgi:hypothetical protein
MEPDSGLPSNPGPEQFVCGDESLAQSLVVAEGPIDLPAQELNEAAFGAAGRDPDRFYCPYPGELGAVLLLVR